MLQQCSHHEKRLDYCFDHWGYFYVQIFNMVAIVDIFKIDFRISQKDAELLQQHMKDMKALASRPGKQATFCTNILQEVTESSKCLGITISEDLTWDRHIQLGDSWEGEHDSRLLQMQLQGLHYLCQENNLHSDGSLNPQSRTHIQLLDKDGSTSSTMHSIHLVYLPTSQLIREWNIPAVNFCDGDNIPRGL